MSRHKTFLCVSCYFKGGAFLEACKQDGNRVLLVTSEKLKNESWPWHAIDEAFYMEEGENGLWDNQHLLRALAYLMRSTKIDTVVALDDFDVERAALIREEFRIPGMGQTTARFFRDKLAMRMKARDGGIPVPGFCALFHDQEINDFAGQTSAPWVIKPRSEASATGIRKVYDLQQLWQVLGELGDERNQYLIEEFVPGNVFHVDSLSYNGENIFSRSSRYLDTPLEVAHNGGIFQTITCAKTDLEHKHLTKLNAKLMKVFGMRHGASHSEYIQSEKTGEYFFLETSSRVGGAHIAEMIEGASGINLWSEWAHMEFALLRGETYQLPQEIDQLAATIISLIKYKQIDPAVFDDPELFWRMDLDFHVGLIIRGPNSERLLELLNAYRERIATDFHAALDAPEKSSH